MWAERLWDPSRFAGYDLLGELDDVAVATHACSKQQVARPVVIRDKIANCLGMGVAQLFVDGLVVVTSHVESGASTAKFVNHGHIASIQILVLVYHHVPVVACE